MPFIRVSFPAEDRVFHVRGFHGAGGSLEEVKQLPLVTFGLPKKGTR